MTEQVTIYILGPLLSAFVLSLPFWWWLYVGWKHRAPLHDPRACFIISTTSYFLSWFLAKVKCFLNTLRAWNLLRELSRDCKFFFMKPQYTRTGFKRYAYTNKLFKLTCCKTLKQQQASNVYATDTLSLSFNCYRHWYMLQSRLFCEITFFLCSHRISSTLNIFTPQYNKILLSFKGN